MIYNDKYTIDLSCFPNAKKFVSKKQNQTQTYYNIKPNNTNTNI